ncbi:hypothetical protein AKJ09_09702 [Labilithrix luteola]|uniref:Uncharacterized protein n=1 Tax=Labilithrix luteola TaxID=1391654 RepID=A0A0K1QBB7_9BACT|nr:hypothetical protein AKJ09_09702 [Labilithrix luteola]
MFHGLLLTSSPPKGDRIAPRRFAQICRGPTMVSRCSTSSTHSRPPASVRAIVMRSCRWTSA